ncbi:peptidyl-prolyl cis-trans isomerase PASTICCINO1 isoform X1 [Physcomitrium patens]|uniref:peptidylprolyl isomerase n=1 Tax=Physcomitrium patens TaxID=3218 RepID=A0A2K1JPW1_PHYPA|nr:peptidyl-prolyl cis-trans isomerase PASTICCINO1-like isoform X1 [Physcomitrium patens]XP_024390653.1 peptidyl-prolyl cis-trans isomerase PASTICCINO1-like isoform X1 [Physcomitrium patens]XP_024390654.1 peptidyl-prolyl cis-trans isomerase PASTICCINO1-like isoform X1 [Physcomitrium patens]PNR43585.1 hypothetical protein PHYPA_015966 [Physcomitrium patens]|eukprot:XP_024390652.1 peptidyl-prolyl cis-trans isomerase PASTICCINO1-like isoform X1 [Physcomitrella patens]
MEELASSDVPNKLKKKESKMKKRVITPGALLKAVVRSGEGTKRPVEGDQIIFHYVTRTNQGVVVETSRSDFGGKGVPLRLVLGKSKMIAGWEEGITTMAKGEIAMLKVQPELHYGDPECPVPVPENFPVSDELLYEVELFNFCKAKIITEDLGVTKVVLEEGEGWETARPPYEVKLWITGRILGGSTFFTHKECDPIHVEFGKEQLPEGLEKAVGTMTRKEKSIIYISSSYCTNSSNAYKLNISPQAQELEFEVQLVQLIQVRDMFGDGGLIKRRLRDGLGEFPVDCPLQDSVLRVHYKAMLPDDGGRIFIDTRSNGGEPVEFASGEGVVPEGLEASLRLMLPGELALINSVSKYAYDKFQRPESVPEGASVQWEVELLEFESAKDWTGLNFQEIMAEADSIKTTGNRLFKEGKHELAKAKYEKVLRDFRHVNPGSDEEAKELQDTNNALQLNVAACYHKLHEYIKCIETCNKVLEGNPHHVKGLFRRGTAYMETGDFDEARADFKQMITVDKAVTVDATAALQKLKQKEREAELKAKKQFKGLFDLKPGELSEGLEEVKPVSEIHEKTVVNEELPIASMDQHQHSKHETEEGSHESPRASSRLLRLLKGGEHLIRTVTFGKCTIL